MALTNVWENTDRLAFFENAILLELKNRTQRTATKTRNSHIIEQSVAATHRTYPYETRGFVDDIALVASGGGGADNVTAACLEVDDCNDWSFVIRLARNDGTNDDMLSQLNAILSDIMQAYKTGKLCLNLYRFCCKC